jgi:outer membrane protein TolC
MAPHSRVTLSSRGGPEIPSGALSIEAAVRVALSHSAEVRAVLAEFGVPEAELWRAIQPRSKGPSGVADSSILPAQHASALSVAYGIITTLKPAVRARVFDQDLVRAEQRVADAILLVAHGVQRAYVDVQYAQEGVAIFPSLADTVAATRAALDRVLGGVPSGNAWTVTDRLGDPRPEQFALASLQALTLSRRPDVVAMRYRARVALSVYYGAGGGGARWDPSISTAIASLRREVADIGPQFVAPLPNGMLLDGEGAKLHMIECVLDYDLAKVDATTELRSTWERHQHAQRVTRELQGSAHTAGLSYLDARRRYWNARADLERATGGTLP